MKPERHRRLVTTAWVISLLAITVIMLARLKGGGVAQHVALGIAVVMWLIFLVSFVVGNNAPRFAESKKRLETWLVFALLALTLASLLLLTAVCIKGRNIVGTLGSLLFVVVLVRALKDFVRKKFGRSDKR